MVAGNDIELIFLGTGTSSSLPNVDCLTASPDEKPPCKTCLSTLTAEGKKNIRRNTCAALRIRTQDGCSVTIIIDAGKNFQAAAIEWFPKYKLRKIDALLITHAHADAMSGLDDLRGWTLRGAIQSHIDVYLSQETYVEVRRSYPYLVAKEFASGGGDVPEFKWHIISDKQPFEVGDTGIRVTPFLVHHGRIFAVAPHPSCCTPTGTAPSSPRRDDIVPPSEQEGTNAEETLIQPYTCFGFKIQNEIAYISDVSFVPQDVWPLLESISVLVLDCLGLEAHASHFGLKEAIQTARRVGAHRTYLTGFGHRVSHEEYVTIGEMMEGAERVAKTENEQRAAALIGQGKTVWLRPAHDGLRVVVGRGVLTDDTYQCK
ncbi:hypothetical protein APHAL10511_006149 [Amanita phalloides]|nr:hypothetical protein APHAL10511_006149 [Amanita phalloides]